MESREGQSLLRTMSFISSRAKALKQKFVPSQRSLSDTWPDYATRAFIDDERPPTPDLGTSLLSLLDESDSSVLLDGKDAKMFFQTQRSKSLDSLNSITVNIHSSSALKDPQLPAATAQRKVSLSVKIPRPTVPKLHNDIRQMESSSIICEPRFGSENTLQIENFPIPKIPGPQIFKLSAPSSPEPSTTFSLSSPGFDANISPQITCITSPQGHDTFAVGGIQMSMTPSGSELSVIPKISKPPQSPTTSRPSTPRTLQSIFSNNSTMFVLPVSPGFSNPSSPKNFEEPLIDNTVIPKIPGPPSSPKHSYQETTNKQNYIFKDTCPYNGSLKFPILSPKSLENQCRKTIVCGDLALPETCLSQIKNISFVERSANNKDLICISEDNFYDGGVLITPEPTLTSRGVTSPLALKKVPTSHTTKPQAESFDCDENRDTITEGLTRPTQFEMWSRPKLKHQWSMDDSRAAVVRNSLGRQTSEASYAGIPIPLKPAEKRRRFFMRKQTNSAPDSFESPTHTPTKQKDHSAVGSCLGNVRKCRGSDSSILPSVLPTIRK